MTVFNPQLGLVHAGDFSVNMNTTSDQLITPTHRYGRWFIANFVVHNASISLTTAAGGLYTGAGKTGTTLVASSQVYAPLTSSTSAPLFLTNSNRGYFGPSDTFYFSLTTAQGAAATATLSVFNYATSFT